MFYPGYRLVARSDVAVTRPALERAGWRCEHCHDADDLRVIDHRGTILVVCDACRVKVGQPLSPTKVKNTKVTKIAAAIATEDQVGFPPPVTPAASEEPPPAENIVKAR